MVTDGKSNQFRNFGQDDQEIRLACFSADGTRLLTVTDVGVARFWDVATYGLEGEIHPTSPIDSYADAISFRTRTDLKDFIESVALNIDGSLALLGFYDGTACLFSTQTGERLAWYYPPDSNPAETIWFPRSVAFSPDGSLALVGFHRRSVGVWKVSDHTLVKFLTGLYPDRIFNEPFFLETMTTSVAASRDNRYIFAGFLDSTVTIWNLDSGEVVFDAHQHVEGILDLWLDGTKVRWATSGGCLWEGLPGQSAIQLFSSGETWLGAAFSPDGQHIIVRTANTAKNRWSIIKRWTIYGKSEVLGKEDALISQSIPNIILGKTLPMSIFINETNRVVIATPNNSVEVKCDSPITGLCLSPQEDILATYTRDNTVQLWRVPSGEPLHVLQHRGMDGEVAFSTDGNLLAVGTFGRREPKAIRPIYVWDVSSGTLRCELRGHSDKVHALAFDPQNRWLVSTSRDRTIRVWQLDHEIPGNSHEIWQLYYADLLEYNLKVLSDGRIIVFRKNSLEVWQEQQKRLDIPVPLSFQGQWSVIRDETCILGRYPQQRIHVWDLETGQELPGYQSDIIRTESVPIKFSTLDTLFSFLPTAGCNLWRTPVGNFVHFWSLPRWWASPLTLPDDGNSIVIPGKENAALVDLTVGQKLVATGPFKGTLRASCILPHQSLLLNSAGQLFIIAGSVNNS